MLKEAVWECVTPPCVIASAEELCSLIASPSVGAESDVRGVTRLEEERECMWLILLE